jgi:STAS-like domain of unknown function (DUF4325)
MSTVACETTVKASTDPSIFILGTRSVAVPLRQQVESTLQNQSGSICLDFAGVTVTQAYMDELLGVLILRYGPSLLDRVAFKTCSDDVQAVIRFVATARIRDYKALTDNSVVS